MRQWCEEAKPRISPIAATSTCKQHSCLALSHIVAEGQRDVYITTPTSFLILSLIFLSVRNTYSGWFWMLCVSWDSQSCLCYYWLSVCSTLTHVTQRQMLRRHLFRRELWLLWEGHAGFDLNLSCFCGIHQFDILWTSSAHDLSTTPACLQCWGEGPAWYLTLRLPHFL